jgi:hypothetical protein
VTARGYNLLNSIPNISSMNEDAHFCFYVTKADRLLACKLTFLGQNEYMRNKKMIKIYVLHIKGTDLLDHIKEGSKHIIPIFYTKIVTLNNYFGEEKTRLQLKLKWRL